MHTHNIKPRIKLDYFIGEITKWQKKLSIGITSVSIDPPTHPEDEGYFFRISKNDSEQRAALVTSKDWDRNFSPPSLFEYIVFSVFTCSLYFIAHDFGSDLKPHKDKGCLFDYTYYKPYRRILVSSPILCTSCRNILGELESTITRKCPGEEVPLLSNINVVLNRKWMGSPDERDSPLFNLKKNYKYDVDRNSGFYKGTLEIFKDSIIDNLPQWIVGTIVVGLIGGILAIFHLKS